MLLPQQLESHRGKIVEVTGYVEGVGSTSDGSNQTFVKVMPNRKRGSEEGVVGIFFLDSELARELKNYPVGSKIVIRAEFEDVVKNRPRVIGVAFVPANKL